jgi:hypothetical protein
MNPRTERPGEPTGAYALIGTPFAGTPFAGTPFAGASTCR